MRDFKAGRDINVEGSVVINDASHTEHKLLIHCTADELLAERDHRHNLLTTERKAKMNKFIGLVAVAGTFLFAAAVWYWANNKMDLFSLVSGGAGMLVGLASLKIWERPTVFEQRQLAALHEIHMLLRERGAKP